MTTPEAIMINALSLEALLEIEALVQTGDVNLFSETELNLIDQRIDQLFDEEAEEMERERSGS